MTLSSHHLKDDEMISTVIVCIPCDGKQLVEKLELGAGHSDFLGPTFFKISMLTKD
jgi:hypothetical protein